MSVVFLNACIDKILGAKQFVQPLFNECSRSGELFLFLSLQLIPLFIGDQAAMQTAQWAGQVCGITT